MQHVSNTYDQMASGPFSMSGLLAKARARTEQELGYSAPEGTTPYASAALGQTPYVAVGNVAIVVQRRGCGNWNC